MSMAAINSRAAYSLYKNKGLPQFDLVYIHPVLSDCIKWRNRFQVFKQILLAAWYLKSDFYYFFFSSEKDWI